MKNVVDMNGAPIKGAINDSLVDQETIDGMLAAIDLMRARVQRGEVYALAFCESCQTNNSDEKRFYLGGDDAYEMIALTARLHHHAQNSAG